MKNFLGNFYMIFIQLGKPLSCLLHHFKHLHHEKADVLLFEDGKADFFPAQEVLSNQQVIERLSHY